MTAAATEAMYRAKDRYVRSLARKYGTPADALDDVAQSVWLAVLCSGMSEMPERYLVGIVRRTHWVAKRHAHISLDADLADHEGCEPADRSADPLGSLLATELLAAASDREAVIRRMVRGDALTTRAEAKWAPQADRMARASRSTRIRVLRQRRESAARRREAKRG